MIITLSGMPGSGKNTVAGILAKKLGFKHFSVGDLRGKMAIERGLTLDEFNVLGEKKDFTDKDVDEHQTELGKKEDDFIIDGRLSWYFIPNSIKVYLDIELKEGAKRIVKTKRPDEKEYKTTGEALKVINLRVASDRKRYKKWYDIDCYDQKHYDLIVDTTNLTPEQVANKILEHIKND